MCQVLFKSVGDIFFYTVTFYLSFCKRVPVCDILLLPWAWSVEIKVMNNKENIVLSSVILCLFEDSVRLDKCNVN